LKINGISVGSTFKPYVIAEMSGNHLGTLNNACELMEKCAVAGANAFKLQTYSASTLTIDCAREEYIVRDGPWYGRTLYDLYSKGHTPSEWLQPLAKLASKLGITLFSTPFGLQEVEILEDIGVQVYKIASFEINYTQLLKKIGSTGKPVIFSTGLATLTEISDALEILRNAGSESIAILKCTTSYPAMATDLNLKTIDYLIKKFNVPVGFSDHTIGNNAAIAAVGAGASIFEKHVKLDKDSKSVDSTFSLPVSKLNDYITNIYQAYDSMGTVQDGPTINEKGYLKYRRSIVASRDIMKGELLSEENIVIIRPSIGLAPVYLDSIIGKRLNQNVALGQGITFEALE
jgi:N-acetylneuraminate synthase